MFIEQLGEDYATSALHGSYMVYQDSVYKVLAADADRVRLYDVAERSVVYVPSSVLSGWKSLKYPRLGFRRLDNGLWGWVNRAARSYQRGLTSDNIMLTFSDWWRSPACAVTNEQRAFINCDIDELADAWDCDCDVAYDRRCDVIISAALMPVYDKPDVFHKMLVGESKSFIPSARLLIEQNYKTQDMFNVHLDGTKVGSLSRDGKIHGPIENQKVIANMVNRYAN